MEQNVDCREQSEVVLVRWDGDRARVRVPAFDGE